MSFIFPPEDSITHEPPKIEDLISLCRMLHTSAFLYEEEIITLITMVLLRLLNLTKDQLSQVHEQTYDDRSFAFQEVRVLVNLYLHLLIRIAVFDSAKFIIGNVGPQFFQDLIELCLNLIDNFDKYSDCAINAMKLLLWLLKDLTPYEDKDTQTARSNFEGYEKYEFTKDEEFKKIDMLKGYCFDLAKDLIFDSYESKYNPPDKRKEVREIITDMLYVLAKTDTGILKTLKDYWKNERKIDQCITFRVKEAIDFMIKNENLTNYHMVKRQGKIKMSEALEKYELYAFSTGKYW